MSEPKELATQRAADQRLALLALTTAAEQPCGACPDAEQLAALVEGRLSRDEADTCLTHLAGCEECYGLWQQLDRCHQERAANHKKKGVIRWVSRPRLLTAVGSLLAAAASVAVFLNITTHIDRSTLPRLAEQPTLEHRQAVPAEEVIGSQAPVPAAPPPPAAREHAGDLDQHLATSKPEPSGQSTRSKMAHPDRPAGGAPGELPAQTRAMRESGKGAEKKAAQAPAAKLAAPTDAQQPDREREVTKEDLLARQPDAAAPVAPQAAMRSEAPAPVAADGATTLTLIDWENSIRNGCRDKPGSEGLDLLAKQGRQLLRQPTALGTAERQRVQRILTTLDARTPVERRCQTLLQLLEEPPPQQKP